MEKAIYFDMDGTIANLYGVENWLDMLRAYNPAPYEQAKVMVNMSHLARVLNKLQKQGYHIGIVSWLSKCPTREYDMAVTKAKYTWLYKHLPSVEFDEIKIVAHGTPKSQAVKYGGGILFDDEQGNRKEWKGQAYDEKNILEILKKLSKNA
jgi:phosphoglycolate phosphatase-like HAD superfamily hydrolase